MRKSPYGEIIVALITPFKEDLSVNYSLAKNLARKLTQEGVDGVLLGGTTGEAPTLTTEEKLRLVSEVRDDLPAGIRVGRERAITIPETAWNYRDCVKKLVLTAFWQ